MLSSLMEDTLEPTDEFMVEKEALDRSERKLLFSETGFNDRASPLLSADVRDEAGEGTRRGWVVADWAERKDWEEDCLRPRDWASMACWSRAEIPSPSDSPPGPERKGDPGALAS